MGEAKLKAQAAIAAGATPAVIRQHRCGTCKFAQKSKQGVLECHFNPPVPFAMQMGPQGQVGIKAFHAPVSDVQWCGRFEPKVLT